MDTDILAWMLSRWFGKGSVGNVLFFSQQLPPSLLGEAVEQEENMCDEVEIVREFAYLGDRVSACGGWLSLGSVVI